MFSALQSELGTWTGIRVLDLYAGSGALGLEALSRGARSAVFVESDLRAGRILAENLSVLGFTSGIVVSAGVERWARESASPEERFDVVFADPPYAADPAGVAAVLDRLSGRGWLRPEALVVVEGPRRWSSDMPESLRHLRERRYGDTLVWYGRFGPRHGLEGAEPVW